ncbi:NAD-dependent epimerase/dehydratase family protein [Tunturiibacter gelidiferens]|uniref:NAD-dependent epimerase/dehydratase family protein n=1 Tax=Tunturiibacter gelidiferens TaxID=3069689 RepID=UPI003D9AFDC7
MRILVIGGNGFIGSPLVSELVGSGHEVAVFHRRSDVGLADSGVVQIQGDRNRLSDYEGTAERPDAKAPIATRQCGSACGCQFRAHPDGVGLRGPG